MNPSGYSPEQQKDIEERVEKAKTLLKDLQLQPGTLMTPVNMGDDVFALKPISYLQDTKYAHKISPITKNDISKD